MAANALRVLFGVFKCSKLDSGDGYTTLSYEKTTELNI